MTSCGRRAKDLSVSVMHYHASRPWPQVEVTEEVDDNPLTHVKLKPTSIDNRGAEMCFNVSNAEHHAFYIGELTHLELKPCSGYTGDLPDKVQFYREVYLLGNALSELIATDTTPENGFTVDVAVDDLPKGLQIVVKAKSTLGSDVTTATVTGIITEPNYAPTSITLSNMVVAENSNPNTA